MSDKSLEELGIFAERFMHFLNLWTIYSDMLSGRYVPTVTDTECPPNITTMLVLYAYFYSLVEDSEDGLNGFRVWRERFPEEVVAITAVETQVAPFRDRLRLFRNRLGFHGSRTRTHESRGYDLFAQHSGTEIWKAMRNFKSLGAALFAKANQQQGIGKLNQTDVRSWIDSVTERARQEAVPTNEPLGDESGFRGREAIGPES